MCLGIPMQVVRSEAMTALCRDVAGAERWIDMLLLGPQPQGAWVLCFLGAARELLDAQRARQIGAALHGLERLMQGDTDTLEAAFADLLGRAPQLPDFLTEASND